ncbi:MAG: adenylyltransferase/cytidyltransferase family protein [Lachnospiraceae bacterium]|nr:adenylyltransferase/cytidyltransferase family protein [Lachnospiraceae bacterium]
MKGYMVYELDEILKIEKSTLNEDILYDMLLAHPERTVYVTESGRVEGIITCGDFKRFIKRKKEIGKDSISVPEQEKLINTDFTFSTIQNEREIENIFRQKQAVISIPVLDEQGKILKEYVREKAKGTEAFNILQLLNQVYKELSLIKKDIYVVIGDLFCEAAGIESELKSKNIHMIRNLPIMEMEQLKNKEEHFIYDLRYELMGITSYFYHKYHLNYFYLTAEIKYMLEHIEILFAHFKSVGVLDCNHFFVKNKVENMQIVSLEKLVWNFQYDCYEYNEVDDEGCPEIFYTIFSISENPYLKWGESFIPICAMLEADSNITYNSERVFKVNDSDIALNIVPALEKRGVRCIIIDNVQSKYSKWEEILDIDLMQIASGICFNDKFEKIEQKNRWGAFFRNGYAQLYDLDTDDVTFSFGERCPEDLDEKLSTMYLFGPCIVWGAYVPNHESIGCLLRRQVGDRVNVRAFGNNWNVINYIIREKEFCAGDIVVIFAGDRQVYDFNHIPVFDIMDVFKSIPNIKSHIRDMPYHCDEEVIRKVADRVIRICEERDYLNKDSNLKRSEKINFGIWKGRQKEVPLGLKQWLESVVKERISNVKKSGAIVMNCNPFTKGHRYLIEESAKRVEALYIFIVEEDKSYFRFEDRIKMVKLGVSDLENVIVIPSGRYIISSETLPGYFEKDTNHDLELDATQDLDLFGGVIAKAFDITVRFAGSEPEDAVTRQYNQQMKRILPSYGVEFFEIPRKRIDGRIVSASSVRKYMDSQDYGRIEQLVLPQVYDYLKKHYFR